jgi:ketosteroid isomerase-like protein
MSQQHVDAVRRACVAWGAGDIPTIRELYATDVVADGGVLWPEGSGSVRGVDAVIAAFESIMTAFERSELIPEGFLEASDTLVVPLLWRGISPGSDSAVEQRLIGSYRFTHGRIAHIAWFATLDQALDALGLPRSAAESLLDADADAAP